MKTEIENEVYDQITEAAHEKHISVDQLIQKAIQDYLCKPLEGKEQALKASLDEFYSTYEPTEEDRIFLRASTHALQRLEEIDPW